MGGRSRLGYSVRTVLKGRGLDSVRTVFRDGFPSGDLYFDVITRLGDAVSFDTVTAETKRIEGIRVSVASPAALYRTKKGTIRALDRQDAEALRQRFDLEDE